MKTIHLFRHGQVEGPAALYGRTDVPLSARGYEALAAATEALPAPDAVVSSPLLRCRCFAELAASTHGVPLQLNEGIREMDFGDWDGVPYRQDNPEWPHMAAFWAAPSEVCPPNGESLTQVQERVIRGWERILKGPDSTTWVFAHGGAIRLIIAHLLQLDWRNPRLYANLSVGYASRTLVQHHRSGGEVYCRALAIAIPVPERAD